jgi:hypothetical protein
MQAFPPSGAAGLAASGIVMLAALHPEAVRRYIVNWDEVALHLVARLHREVAASPEDEDRRRLLAVALAQPGVPADWRAAPLSPPAAPFVAVHLRSAALEVRLFTMLTTIGTPVDVTAEEVQVESYFPADEATDAALRRLAGVPPGNARPGPA